MLPVVREKKMTVREQIAKLDEQRANLIAQVESDTRKKLDEALADYNSLGHNFSLSENGKRKKGTRNTDPTKKFCNICEVNGHDGRAHRSQGKKKQKFTAAEIKELGL